jgi:hypothetical protein
MFTGAAFEAKQGLGYGLRRISGAKQLENPGRDKIQRVVTAVE